MQSFSQAFGGIFGTSAGDATTGLSQTEQTPVEEKKEEIKLK